MNITQGPAYTDYTGGADHLFALALLLEKFNIVKIVNWHPLLAAPEPQGLILTKMMSGTTYYAVVQK